MSPLEITITLVGALVLGVFIPWALVAMLYPALRENLSAVTTNYRGRQVVAGLGIVWLAWAGCAIVGGTLLSSVARGSSLAVLTLAGPLALVAFALGVVDDAYGSSAARGFKGHVKAMFEGRLTTGGLKLVGIGTASLVVALIIARIAPWGSDGLGASLLGKSLIAGAAIALTSNFVNLTDLRPGRALKIYSVLAVLGVASTLAALVALAPNTSVSDISVQSVALLLFVLGPVAATWRYDLRELGMLGDAGANPMGAVAGMLIVLGLPLWGLVIYFAAMLALNAASERVSYSRVIESTALLRRIDSVGRLASESIQSEGAKTSPQSETDPE